MASTEVTEVREDTQLKTLGNLRLRDSETNNVILVPTPSSDPKDPLNWHVPVLFPFPFCSSLPRNIPRLMA